MWKLMRLQNHCWISSDSEVTEEQWTEAFTTSYEQVAASLARGQSVVHDATNYDRAARHRVRAIAYRFGSSAYFIYIAVLK
jgi:predicted kinase